MIAPAITIPPGLEEAYYKIVAPLGGVNPNTIITKRPSPAKKNYANVARRSLFVKWYGIYNALSSDRHTAWTLYWQTLPFGSHIGAGGWPGSGFSAFVYVNTPRYHAGEDLLLDPPVSANLLTNPNFNGNADSWYFGDGFFYNDHDVSIPHGDWGGVGFFGQVLEIINGASYHVSFEIRFSPLSTDGSGISDVNLKVSAGNDSPTPFHFNNLHFTDSDYHTVECDITGEWDDPDSDRVFQIDAGLIDALDGTNVDITNIILTLNP